MTDLVHHYAKLSNSYASKAGQLYGILEILPIITSGLDQDAVRKAIETAADRAKEIMST